MRLTQENYLNEVNKRINFYYVLSHESPEVKFESFKVYKHPDSKKQHFLHLKYVLVDKDDPEKVISHHEEIETFIRARKKAERGWPCIINQDKPEDIIEFLKDVTEAEDVTIPDFKFEYNDDKAEV